MGYARYGSSGKGLSDRAQRTYNAIRRSRVSGVARVYADREAMLFGKEQRFRGLYQLPGAPGLHVYTPAFQKAYAAAGTQERTSMLSALHPKKVSSQFGMHTAGRGGYPSWVMQMLGKGTALGKPPVEKGEVGTLLGLATAGVLVWKVFL